MEVRTGMPEGVRSTPLRTSERRDSLLTDASGEGYESRLLSLLALALAVAELDAADLAADGLGQLGDELDLSRVFVGRGDGLDVLLQLGGELIARRVRGGEDDEGLDDLAADGVGAGDDRSLDDGGVLDEGALDLEG